ncbi:MAG: hypothetical protein NT047_11990 [Deltaproteobacteria bacterium]|nr:hypothetical protein [Deltaproteobacteria bacterium]
MKESRGATAVLTGQGGEDGAAVAEDLSRKDRDRVMMIEGRVLKPEDRIHDLVDPLDSGFREKNVLEMKVGPEKIYDLVDVVERRPRMALVDTGLHDEIMKRAVEIAEKIAREVIPDIAERVIREEIEKLKKGV